MKEEFKLGDRVVVMGGKSRYRYVDRTPQLEGEVTARSSQAVRIQYFKKILGFKFKLENWFSISGEKSHVIKAEHY